MFVVRSTYINIFYISVNSRNLAAWNHEHILSFLWFFSFFQPYRTTPLVLPGAKVKKDAPSTDSYLKHYPNPAVRAHPGHDYHHHDSLMKQRVADTMLHRVVGQDADSGKVSYYILTYLALDVKLKVIADSWKRWSSIRFKISPFFNLSFS